MIKVMFVCLGNICRSPMAEFVFKDIVKKQGLEKEFYIKSSATSSEEIGNDIHYGTRNKLIQEGISFEKREATKLKTKDYEKYDYIIGMDTANIRNLNRMLKGDPEGKIRLLLEMTGRSGDIADPWYTGDFQLTYLDIEEGCKGFLQYLKENGKING